MSSFCIANLLSPSTKTNLVRPSSIKKSPTPPKSLDFNLPVDTTSLLSTTDFLQMASATMMNSYNQQNLASVFSPTLPNAYPFAQLPPFFVNGFPTNGYFGPNVFQPNGIMLQQLSGRRKRRHRTIFTDEQLAVLESNFCSNQYPDVTLREKLALQCELKEERVEVWFKNRRAKERKKRHDFPIGNPSGSTESGTASPFFERSSSSEHKVTDDSDCEDFLDKRSADFMPKYPNTQLDAILRSQSTIQDQNSNNKRKKRHSADLLGEELSPIAKKSRPNLMEKSQAKLE